MKFSLAESPVSGLSSSISYCPTHLRIPASWMNENASLQLRELREMRLGLRTRSLSRSRVFLHLLIQRLCFSLLQSSLRKSLPPYRVQWLTFCFRAIPNGVVNSFSTIIIKDMVRRSFLAWYHISSLILMIWRDSLLPEQLSWSLLAMRFKSLHSSLEVQLPWMCRTVNTPDLKLFQILLIHFFYKSSASNCNRRKHPLHSSSRMHGLPPKVKHLGTTRQLLARQRAISRLHRISDNRFFKYGWIHTSIDGKRDGFVSCLPQIRPQR